MESHRQADCPDEVRVGPRRQGQEGLVLGERVESLRRDTSTTTKRFPLSLEAEQTYVEHLDDDQDRKRHGRRPLGHLVGEHVATDERELL